MALNLITRVEYKTYAGIKSTNQDAAIDGLIPRVSLLVKNYCRKTFVDYVDTPRVEIFNGGTDYLVMAESPNILTSEVAVSSDYGQTYVPLTKFTDWVNNGDLIYPLSASNFPKQLLGYKVTYTAGYDDVPVDIALAVMDLINYYMKNDPAVHSNKAPGANSVQVEYITTASLPAHIRRVLDLYVSDYT